MTTRKSGIVRTLFLLSVYVAARFWLVTWSLSLLVAGAVGYFLRGASCQ